LIDTRQTHNSYGSPVSSRAALFLNKFFNQRRTMSKPDFSNLKALRYEYTLLPSA
jgi:hypothetical protein